MRNNTLHQLLLSLFILGAATACASVKEDAIQGYRTGNSNDDGPSIAVSKDSLERVRILSLLQSRPGPVILQHVVRTGDTFQLVLSASDALEIGISQEDYQYYKQLIENSEQ